MAHIHELPTGETQANQQEELQDTVDFAADILDTADQLGYNRHGMTWKYEVMVGRFAAAELGIERSEDGQQAAVRLHGPQAQTGEDYAGLEIDIFFTTGNSGEMAVSGGNFSYLGPDQKPRYHDLVLTGQGLELIERYNQAPASAEEIDQYADFTASFQNGYQMALEEADV